MAGDWLKWEKGLEVKPEIDVIARAVGIDSRIVPTLLFRVWEWADSNTQDGTSPVSTAFIDRLAGVPGFADAMHKAGWLEHDDEGILLPNYMRHNGQCAKKRLLQSRRSAISRDKRHADGVTKVTQTP